MGRRKSIDRAMTMDAIEAVVRQHGLAGLSIDAVARQAGISKSSVVYDFRNKNALLAAFIANRMENKRALVTEARQRHVGRDNPWIRGLLDTIAQTPTQEDMDTAIVIAAGMGSGAECRTAMQEKVAEDLATVMAEADCARAAMLSYLAAYGLLTMEYFGFHRFAPDLRNEILQDIGWLLSVRPTIAETDPEH